MSKAITKTKIQSKIFIFVRNFDQCNVKGCYQDFQTITHWKIKRYDIRKTNNNDWRNCLGVDTGSWLFV